MSDSDLLSRLRTQRGRGALSNSDGRSEPYAHEAVDDGWESADAAVPVRKTTVQEDHARSVIVRQKSPDIPFDQSINPYRGCEHGCIYCYARPSHAYLGLSPGLDFESRLFYKPQAAKLLAAELRKTGYICRPIALGSNTDPYQPVERKHEITRAILEVPRAAGATSAGYTLLRLPLELKSLFKEWLEANFPAKAAHVLSLVAQTHGGQLYDSTWFKRKTGTGPYAEVLRLRFERACRK